MSNTSNFPPSFPPPPPQPTGPAPTLGAAPKKSKTGLIAGVAAVALAVGGIAVFATKSDDKAAAPTTTVASTVASTLPEATTSMAPTTDPATTAAPTTVTIALPTTVVAPSGDSANDGVLSDDEWNQVLADADSLPRPDGFPTPDRPILESTASGLCIALTNAPAGTDPTTVLQDWATSSLATVLFSMYPGVSMDTITADASNVGYYTGFIAGRAASFMCADALPA